MRSSPSHNVNALPLRQLFRQSINHKPAMSSSHSPSTHSTAIEEDYGHERVVLRTIDEAFFRVEKQVLAINSVIFRSLFRSNNEPKALNSTRTLEESHSNNENTLKISEEKAADGLPFIRVATHGRTLDALLQLVYGITGNGSPERNVKDVDNVKDTLLLAHTYGFVSVVDKLCDQLLSDLAIPFEENRDINNGPQINIFALRVYALACRLQRTSLAEAAAYQTLRGRVVPAPGHGESMEFPELQELPALDYCRLQDYHAKSGEIVAKVFELEEDGEDCGLPAPYAELTRCFECSEGPAGVAGKAAWWRNYVSRAARAVREVPRTQLIFSSDFLKEAYEAAEKCTGDCRTQIDARWLALSLVLKERIETALAKVFSLSPP